MKVKVTNVRAAFPAYFEPKSIGDSKDTYYAGAFPIEPNSENAKAIDAAIKAEAIAKWGTKADAVVKKLKEDGRVCFQHKALTDGEGNVYGGFDDMWSLNASRNSKKGPIAVLDKDKTPLTQTSGKPYAGCYVDVLIEVWAMDNKYGKRINAELKGVQFRKDGDAFAGGTPASPDDFEDLSTEEETAENEFG